MKKLTHEPPFLSDNKDMPVIDMAARESGFTKDSVQLIPKRVRAERLIKRGMISRSEAEAVNYEIVVGRSNLLPACFLDVGSDRSRSVCKIETSGTDGQGHSGAWCGTGVLVAESVLMTNCHVLNSPEVARNGVAIFNYQLGPAGQELPTKRFRLNPDRLFVTSPVNELDFAFVWVEETPGKEFSHVPLERNSFVVNPGDLVNIIQHPSGEPKQLALQENEVTTVDPRFVRYKTDTQPGSSGSCVFDNDWRPVALHHASRVVGKETNNEGIRFSAIATQLEKIAELGEGHQASSAKAVLALFKGTDSLLGFFGSLGRTTAPEGTGLEAVVNSYQGEASDVDVAFWNVEWFANRYKEKVTEVAAVIARMNLDVWSFEESSPAATKRLIEMLKEEYGLEFEAACSEPNAGTNKQTTTVIWNTKTVTAKRCEWPQEVEEWFHLNSREYEPGAFADLGLEAVDGNIFDRYPGLFYIEALNRANDQAPFNFYLVPLHLKAMADGSKRRQLASEILAAAVAKTKQTNGYKDEDWVLGGDFNAELATGDFAALTKRGLTPLSAADEKNGAFTYLKSPKSLIDHIFLSANLAKTYGADNYFIVAEDKEVPNYVTRVSDHRPVLVRLSLHDQQPDAANNAAFLKQIPSSLLEVLNELRGASPKA
jgi:V8-like Glu-specific endopeptidase